MKQLLTVFLFACAGEKGDTASTCQPGSPDAGTISATVDGADWSAVPGTALICVYFACDRHPLSAARRSLVSCRPLCCSRPPPCSLLSFPLSEELSLCLCLRSFTTQSQASLFRRYPALSV